MTATDFDRFSPDRPLPPLPPLGPLASWPSPSTPPLAGPSAPEPTKKRRKWPFVAALVAMAVAGGGIGAAVTRSNDRGTAATSSAATAAPATASVLESSGSSPSKLAPTGLDIHSLIEKVKPSVVSVEIGQRTSSGRVSQLGAGSGVVISTDGLVVTNAHVINATDSFGRTLEDAVITVTMYDGTSREVEVLGSAPASDFAVLRLKDTSNLVAANLGDSDALRVGDDVVAIGNSLDLGTTPTVTKGIISAKDRTLQVDANVRLTGLLQTDAAINRGNSGGALVNAAGELIGIPSAGIPNAQNVGFAIAINTVKPLIDQAKSGVALEMAAASGPIMGVTVVSTVDGVEVTGVSDGFGADRAGIQANDRIVAIEGNEIVIPTDISDVLRSRKAGDTVDVEIERAGAISTVSVTLGARSA